MTLISIFILATCLSATWCQQLPNILTHCDSDIICDEEIHEQHVCGSDGQLYASQCEFNKAHCSALQGGDAIMPISFGTCVDALTPCDIVMQTKCVPSTISVITGNGDGFEAVCGTDGVTYGSICEFRTSQCHRAAAPQDAHVPQIDVAYGGKCKQNTTNSIAVDCSVYMTDTSGIAIEGGAGTALFPKPCLKIYDPVCSTDGRTYGNECLLCSYYAHARKITSDNVMAYVDHMGQCSGAAIG